MLVTCTRGHCSIPQNSCPSAPVGGPCGAYDISYNTYLDSGCTEVSKTGQSWCAGSSCQCGLGITQIQGSTSIAWTCSTGYAVPQYTIPCCTTLQQNCNTHTGGAACSADATCAWQGTSGPCLPASTCMADQSSKWVVLASPSDSATYTAVATCMAITAQSSCSSTCIWCPNYYHSVSCAYKPATSVTTFDQNFEITWTNGCPSKVVDLGSAFEARASFLTVAALALVSAALAHL